MRRKIELSTKIMRWEREEQKSAAPFAESGLKLSRIERKICERGRVRGNVCFRELENKKEEFDECVFFNSLFIFHRKKIPRVIKSEE